MSVNTWTVSGANFIWLDIINPTVEELKAVSEKYNLHHYTLRDCLEADHLPKHEDLGDTHFVITRILNPSQTNKTHTVQEFSSKIAVFYNDEFIITVHRLPQIVLEEIKSKYVETGKLKKTSELVTKIIWFVLHSCTEYGIFERQQK